MSEEERKARKREQGKRYYEANKEKKKEYQRAYHAAHREKANERSRQYHEAHKDRARAYQAKYVPAHRLRRKAERVERKLAAIERMGGRCADCEQTFHHAVFEFHHLEPTEKEYEPYRLFAQKDQEKIDNELAKCVLLCANCHRLRHYTD